MLEHHKESIEKLIDYYKDDKDIISIILGGSVAKGFERADSDIDAIVVVTEGKFAEFEKENRLAECITGHCTYENGYFDIKYTTIRQLKETNEKGSEPARNAFVSSRCIYGFDDEVLNLIKSIPVFQKQEKDEKMLSFYSALVLNRGYFWSVSNDNIYLKTRTATDIILFGLRLILQNNEVFFPCQKALFETVEKMDNKPAGIIEKATRFLTNMTDETKDDFTETVLNFIDYKPPEDYSIIMTRFIDDNELWWRKNRPIIAEW